MGEGEKHQAMFVPHPNLLPSGEQEATNRKRIEESSMPRLKPAMPARDKRLHRGERGGIELLLIQSVDHLGKQGEVVEVKRGYAMNYLLPQGLATVATDHHKRMVEKHKAKLLQIQHERLAGLRQLADRITAQSVTIEANANDEGHLYGSVGAAEIVRAIKQHDITITVDQVRLKGPLKELGLYTVDIHLGQDIEAQLKVWVVPTVGDVEPAAEAKPEAKEGEAKAAGKSGDVKAGGKGAEAKAAAKPAEAKTAAK
jgi:large subunit ribosomal protein L9